MIDDEIAALEEKIQDLEEQISSNASNFVKLNELMAQKAQAEEALEQKMDRWVVSQRSDGADGAGTGRKERVIR